MYGWLISKKLVNSPTVIFVKEEKKNVKKNFEGLVDYNEYDVVWPDALKEGHSITRRK